MESEKCLFCSIVKGTEPAEVILDLPDHLVIKNKYPKAPVHLLVVDKKHHEKSDTISGAYTQEHYWDSIFSSVYKVVETVDALKGGHYEVVLNGTSYGHFTHEHVHILGGYAGGTGART